ncbi:MAG: TrkA family potassium uptake protein [Armatimonadetes bacterium]|nr:TrkA family potassium uptake protein [Armatimonadota bacterium]
MPQTLQFAVIGLGRFGSRVARGLYQQGHDVVAVDSNPDAVQEISDGVTTALCGDATRDDVLTSVGVDEMDTVVVAIGDNVEASILVTGLLSQRGCRRIVARASTDLHARILEMVGAHEVVYPERELARRLVRSLSSPNVREYVPIQGNLEFVQMTVPAQFVGHSLAELDVRNKYRATVVAVQRAKDEEGNRETLVPHADYVFQPDDMMWVVGHEPDLRRLESLK